MKGKIILNLAMSLDGYIANEDGSFDWITGDGNKKLNTTTKFDFEQFLSDIDIVVMGRQCYEQGFASDYKNKTVYVATSQKQDDFDNIKFIGGDITAILTSEQANGKNIFLFGGGVVIDPFIKANIIDEYIVGIIPTILGKGRKLFLENNPNIKLILNDYTIDEGVIVMRYSKRN